MQLTIEERIEASEDDFRANSVFVKLAMYVREHIDDIAFRTAHEVAARAGVSGSAAVRFAQRIGFAGWPDLRAAAQNEYRMRQGGTVYVQETAPPAPAVGEPVVIVERAVYDDALLAAVSDMLRDRDAEVIPGRHPLRVAITHLANATGPMETSHALRALAVEALAWDRAIGARSSAQADRRNLAA